MHNIFKGIVVGVLGFVVWFLLSVVVGAGDAFNVARDPVIETFRLVGFFLMIGGPVVYIVALPAWGWWKRRRARGG